jgi:hypothetical protein
MDSEYVNIWLWMLRWNTETIYNRPETLDAETLDAETLDVETLISNCLKPIVEKIIMHFIHVAI